VIGLGGDGFFVALLVTGWWFCGSAAGVGFAPGGRRGSRFPDCSRATGLDVVVEPALLTHQVGYQQHHANGACTREPRHPPLLCLDSVGGGFGFSPVGIRQLFGDRL
jgi:hypothetical protein